VAVWYALSAALMGLVFGSAINAMVWRIYVGRSWAKGRSVCPDCGHVLGVADLVPVLSWLALGGKCRYCKAPIKDHPVVELVTGVAFGLSAYVTVMAGDFDLVKLGFWLVMLVMLLVLAVYDVRWMILPDKIMLPLMAVAAVYALVSAAEARSLVALAGMLAAAVVAGGGFYLIVWLSRGRAMGGGDIKLAFTMGLILGPTGTAVAMLLAVWVAAVVGVAMVAARKRGFRNQRIPFGPFLVGGTVVAFLYGQTLVDWYLRVNGL